MQMEIMGTDRGMVVAEDLVPGYQTEPWEKRRSWVSMVGTEIPVIVQDKAILETANSDNCLETAKGIEKLEMEGVEAQ